MGSVRHNMWSATTFCVAVTVVPVRAGERDSALPKKRPGAAALADFLAGVRVCKCVHACVRTYVLAFACVRPVMRLCSHALACGRAGGRLIMGLLQSG